MKRKTKTKKHNKDLVLIAMLLVLIVVFGLIYFIPKFIPNNKTISEEYYFNGFHFQKLGPLWYTQIQKNKEVFDLPMHYGPRDLLNYSIDNITSNEIKDFFYKKVAKIRGKDNFVYSYLTFNPYNNLSYITLSATELTFKLFQTMRIKLIGACTENKTGSGCEDRLKINCSSEFPVIFLDNNLGKNNFSDSYPEGISVSNNCLVIKADEENMLRWTDRLLYTLFGIMN